MNKGGGDRSLQGRLDSRRGCRGRLRVQMPFLECFKFMGDTVANRFVGHAASRKCSEICYCCRAAETGAGLSYAIRAQSYILSVLQGIDTNSIRG